MKVRSLLELFLYISIAIFIVGIFVFSCILMVKVKSIDVQLIRRLGINWSQGLITELFVSGSRCPSDYENVLTDSFEGTVEGCLCNNFPLERGSCKFLNDDEVDYDLFSKNCKKIPATPKVPYTMWRGNYICSKRLRINYFTLETSAPLTKCPDNMKKCGKLDSLGNLYCVDQAKQCPLNGLIVSDTTSKTPNDFKYSEYKLNDKKMFATNENSQGKIITNFKISDGEPCANFHYQNSYNGYFYILNQKFYQQPCSDLVGDAYFDYRYHLVDTYNNVNLYIDNNVYDQLKNLPEMPPIDFDTNLYSRGYFGVKRECRANIVQIFPNPDVLVMKLLNVEWIFKDLFRLSLIIFVTTCMLLLGITIGIYNNFNNCMENRKILSIVTMVFIFIFCVLSSIFFSKLMNFRYYYNTFYECLDDINNVLIKRFDSEVYILKSVSLYLIVFSVICILLFVFELMSKIWVKCITKCLCIRRKKKKKKDKPLDPAQLLGSGNEAPLTHSEYFSQSEYKTDIEKEGETNPLLKK